MVSYIIAVLSGVALLVADQVTKYLISSSLAMYETHEFINGFIELTYIHNRGGAWGMLYGHTYILVPVTVAVMVLCIFFFIKYGKNSRILLYALTLVISGGLGNMLDRVFNNGNVVDFLHFEFFPSFPVFNVADCAIVAGAGLLILYFILDSLKDMRLKKSNEITESENDGKH